MGDHACDEPHASRTAHTMTPSHLWPIPAPMTAADPRQQALIASLRSRFAEALRSGNAEAKKALFKEAVYLGIQPDLFGPIPSDQDPAGS